MAAKKAKKTGKQGTGSKGKKAAPASGKKATAAKGNKPTAAARKGVRPGAKKGAATLAATKHENLRIGLQAKSTPPRVLLTGLHNQNTIRVYGDRIGTGSPGCKRAFLDATHHAWQNPPIKIQNAGRDALDITARCVVRNTARSSYDTDDDLTVTIELLDNAGNPTDETECYFDDVEYDA